MAGAISEPRKDAVPVRDLSQPKTRHKNRQLEKDSTGKPVHGNYIKNIILLVV